MPVTTQLRRYPPPTLALWAEVDYYSVRAINADDFMIMIAMHLLTA